MSSQYCRLNYPSLLFFRTPLSHFSLQHACSFIVRRLVGRFSTSSGIQQIGANRKSSYFSVADFFLTEVENIRRKQLFCKYVTSADFLIGRYFSALVKYKFQRWRIIEVSSFVFYFKGICAICIGSECVLILAQSAPWSSNMA